jgi:DNA-binding NarL/FixJ family response regulator
MPAAAAIGQLRIVIADDHELFAQGLAELLGGSPELEVVGRAANGAEAVALTASLHPDVVLMDVEMPCVDGITATREIVSANEGTRVLMVSSSTEPDVVSRARSAGAAGYLFKGSPLREVIAAIHEVASPSNLAMCAA